MKTRSSVDVRLEDREAGCLILLVVLFLSFTGCNADDPGVSLLPPPEEVFQDEVSLSFARAAMTGDLPQIEKLLQANGSFGADRESDAIPYAYSIYNLQAFRYLLARGVNPNVTLGDFNSILHLAVGKRDIEFLRLALEYGADPNIRTREWGETPLFLIDGDDAATRIKLLVSAGADIEALSDAQETPLIAHARAQRYDVVQLLLENGANFQVRTDSGWSITKAIDSALINYGDKEEHQRKLISVIEYLFAECERQRTLICDEVREIDAELRAAAATDSTGLP